MYVSQASVFISNQKKKKKKSNTEGDKASVVFCRKVLIFR